MRYLVTNFAYGTGPYLRTTELAIAVNRELEAAGARRLGIIVPWVYGEKQKRVMLEEFSDYETLHPGGILLDAKLGALLQSVFYGDNTYQEALGLWVENFEAASREAGAHLGKTIEVETLAGELVRIRGGDIVIELSRAPRLAYGIAPVFSATFAHTSEILEHALEVDEETIGVRRNLVRRAVPLARRLEQAAAFQGLAEPGTFSYLQDRTPRYPTEVVIPPTMKIFGNRTVQPPQPKRLLRRSRPSGAVSDFKRDPSSRPQRDSGLLFVPAIHPQRRGDPAKSGMRLASGPPAARYSGGQTINPPRPNNDEPIKEGIYVTITGIPGLERLYAETQGLGLRLYSNDPGSVPGSEYFPPRLIPNPGIKLQFARAGWSSIWLSQLTATPFLAPDFDPADDPEIYFNNRCIERLGLGVIYRGQPLGEILDEAERLRPGIQSFNDRLQERFGMLDGNTYAARRITAEYLKRG